VLPEVVQRFAQRFPQVRLKLMQGNPPQIAAMIASGQADVGMATETLADAAGLDSIPVYQWEHVAVVPAGHALARLAAHPEKLTLKELGRYPIVTYEAHFSGRSRIDAAFAAAQIEPSIVLEAIDADVIKTYARAGLGVGLVAGVALEQNAEGLAVIGCGHLFGRNTTRLAVKQGAYLRGFVYSFIEMVAPGWDRSRLEQEFSGRSSASRADK
jgi:LysR family cys regulon transcriptional activator